MPSCAKFTCDRMRHLRGSTLRFIKIAAIVLVVTFVIWYMVCAFKRKVTPLYADGVVEIQIGDISYDFSTGVFTLRNNHGIYLHGVLSETLRSASAHECRSKQVSTLCLNWIRYTKLEVTKTVEDSVVCHQITWTPTSKDFSPHDCLSLRGGNWYGGSDLRVQTWPLENADIPLQPYVSNDVLFKKQSPGFRNLFGNIAERYWINSNGVAIIVDSSVPLFVSVNESSSKILCFRADYANSPYSNPENDSPVLQYKICKDENVKTIHQYLTDKHLELPIDLPDVSLIKGPVWSTWAKFKGDLDQSKILTFAQEIKENDFKFDNAVFEISGPYSSAYGNFDFKPDSYKNAHQMLSILRESGFKIVVSMTLFVGMESKDFKKNSNFWLQDIHGIMPSMVKFQKGMAAIVDTTNPNSAIWYFNRLRSMLNEYNIKSFFFHGCESNYFPSSYKTFLKSENPNLLTQKFISNISDIGQKMIQSNCAFKLQKHSLYVVLGSRESHWEKDNGLQSLIPATLTLGLVGYPYVIPDVIGGNGVLDNDTLVTWQPERELYIRWMQLSAYMPVMKFSYPPWDYDIDVINIARNLLKIRKEKVVPILLKAVRESELTGAPIIRPLWWNDPKDSSALECDSQFLVGNSILVAPVLTADTRQRDIYLPNGQWFDEINKKKLKGGQWLKNYKVELYEIATFSKLKHS